MGEEHASVSARQPYQRDSGQRPDQDGGSHCADAAPTARARTPDPDPPRQVRHVPRRRRHRDRSFPGRGVAAPPGPDPPDLSLHRSCSLPCVFPRRLRSQAARCHHILVGSHATRSVPLDSCQLEQGRPASSRRPALPTRPVTLWSPVSTIGGRSQHADACRPPSIGLQRYFHTLLSVIITTTEYACVADRIASAPRPSLWRLFPLELFPLEAVPHR